MYVGFNLKKADEMVDSIVEKYNSLGRYISEAWGPVAEKLQAEWVGPDEQSFEKNFVKRICELYVSSYELASGCTKTLAELSDQWVSFQRNNTLDGSTAADLDTAIAGILEKFKEFLFGSPRLRKNENIVLFMPKVNLDLNTNRGLQNANSAQNIQAAVETFVTTLKNQTQGLFSDVDVNSAFFGDQASSIKAYIDSVSTAIGEVLTAVKDLNEKLAELAGSQYGAASENIAQSYSQNKASVDASVDGLGSSRWV